MPRTRPALIMLSSAKECDGSGLLWDVCRERVWLISNLMKGGDGRFSVVSRCMKSAVFIGSGDCGRVGRLIV